MLKATCFRAMRSCLLYICLAEKKSKISALCLRKDSCSFGDVYLKCVIHRKVFGQYDHCGPYRVLCRCADLCEFPRPPLAGMIHCIYISVFSETAYYYYYLLGRCAIQTRPYSIPTLSTFRIGSALSVSYGAFLPPWMFLQIK